MPPSFHLLPDGREAHGRSIVLSVSDCFGPIATSGRFSLYGGSFQDSGSRPGRPEEPDNRTPTSKPPCALIFFHRVTVVYYGVSIMAKNNNDEESRPLAFNWIPLVLFFLHFLASMTVLKK